MLSAFPTMRDEAHREWLETLPRICEELASAGEAEWGLARWLAVRQWEWIEAELRQTDRKQSPSEATARLTALVPPLLGVLRSAAVIGAFDVLESIVQQLAAVRTERRVDFLTALLRSTAEGDADLRPALRPIHELYSDALAAWLSMPPREPGDWSILTELGCRCERCGKLRAFLTARERRVFEWPLAQEHRAHVHQIIERNELPLAHQTRRTGRPYTLVLTKREALFEREAAQRKRWSEDLEWLQLALS